MTGAIDISVVDLSISFVFVLLAGILSVYHKLKLEKDLLIGTIRTTVHVECVVLMSRK